MKRNILTNLFLIMASAFLFCSCYDDKGSNKYSDINEVIIDVPEKVSVILPKVDSLLVELSPKLSQTIEQGESNLSYKWETVEAMNIQQISNYQICSLYIFPGDKDVKVRLTVLDKTMNTNWYKEVMVVCIPPFATTWFVLQDESGQSVLGAVDGASNGEGIVVKDVYLQETGNKLNLGKPIGLEFSKYYGSMAAKTLPPAFVPTMGFNPIKRVIAIAAQDGMEVLNSDSMTPIWRNGIKDNFRAIKGFTPNLQSLCFSEDNGEAAINNNKLYWANMDGYSMYRTAIIANESTFNASAVGSLYRNGFIVYDGDAGRFLHCYSKDGVDALDRGTNKPIVTGGSQATDSPNATVERIEANDKENVFNPDKVQAGFKVLNFISGGESGCYTYACGYASDNKVHIYRFNNYGWSGNDVPKCDGHYSFATKDIAADIETSDLESLRFAVSYAYNGIIFMSAKNRVYKIDLNRSVPKVLKIYENSNAGAKVASMKFKNWFAYYDNEYDTKLGVAINYSDSEGGVVELKLNSAGDVLRGEGNIVEYTGFGKVVDLVYSFK